MSPGTLQGVAVPAAFVAGVSMVSIVQAGSWATVHLDTIFQQCQDSVHCAVLGLSE